MKIAGLLHSAGLLLAVVGTPAVAAAQDVPPPQGEPYGQPQPNQYGQPQPYGQPAQGQPYQGQPAPAPQPQPDYGQGAPPGQAAYDDGYARGYADARGGGRYEEPPPPPPPEDEDGGRGDGKFEMPPWSVRLDPFNWILEGRLGFELEAGLLDFMTVELVPVFVVNESPPTLNYFGGFDDELTQESNGIGALSGVSIGAGFWLSGKPLRGTVIRAIFQNHGMTYKTSIDEASHTQRVLMGMLGSVSRFGAFTIASGIGLGVDLNEEERCFQGPLDARTTGCGEIQVRSVDGPLRVTNFLYPAVLEGRISLGVTID